jgi:hypothetical protein
MSTRKDTATISQYPSNLRKIKFKNLLEKWWVQSSSSSPPASGWYSVWTSERRTRLFNAAAGEFAPFGAVRRGGCVGDVVRTTAV